jgi:hypothetical protein
MVTADEMRQFGEFRATELIVAISIEPAKKRFHNSFGRTACRAKRTATPFRTATAFRSAAIAVSIPIAAASFPWRPIVRATLASRSVIAPASVVIGSLPESARASTAAIFVGSIPAFRPSVTATIPAGAAAGGPIAAKSVAHLRAHDLAFFFVQLSVIVFVKFRKHAFADSHPPARFVRLTWLVRWLSHCGPRYQAGCNEQRSTYAVPHFRPPSFACVGPCGPLSTISTPRPPRSFANSLEDRTSNQVNSAIEHWQQPMEAHFSGATWPISNRSGGA